MCIQHSVIIVADRYNHESMNAISVDRKKNDKMFLSQYMYRRTFGQYHNVDDFNKIRKILYTACMFFNGVQNFQAGIDEKN